jgi:hypothetical protein
MLVVEDWHGAFTLLENPDNLLIEPPVRIPGHVNNRSGGM